MPAAASAGRSTSSRGPGSASRARPARAGRRRRVAADAAGTVEVEDRRHHSIASSGPTRTLPGPAAPDTGRALPSARPAGCMRPVTVVPRPLQCRHAHRPARTSMDHRPARGLRRHGVGRAAALRRARRQRPRRASVRHRRLAHRGRALRAVPAADARQDRRDALRRPPGLVRLRRHRGERVRPRARPLRVPRRRLQPLPGDAHGPHRALRLRRVRLRLLRAVRPRGRLHLHQRVPALHGAAGHELGRPRLQRHRRRAVAVHTRQGRLPAGLRPRLRGQRLPPQHRGRQTAGHKLIMAGVCRSPTATTSRKR